MRPGNINNPIFDNRNAVIIHMNDDLKYILTQYTQMIYRLEDVIINTITNIFNSPTDQALVVGIPKNNQQYDMLKNKTIRRQDLSMQAVYFNDYRMTMLHFYFNQYGTTPYLFDTLVDNILLALVNVESNHPLSMPKDDKYHILLNACNVATQVEREARPYDAIGHDTIIEAYNPDTRKFITRDPQYAQQIKNIVKDY